MSKGSIRRFDVQAKVSLLISAAGVVGLLALAYLLYRNYHADMKVVMYGRKGMYGPIIFILTAITLLMSATGAAIGANSAGQRRNEYTRRSWAAFFIGAATISLTIIAFSVFWWFRMPLQ